MNPVVIGKIVTTEGVKLIEAEGRAPRVGELAAGRPPGIAIDGVFTVACGIDVDAEAPWVAVGSGTVRTGEVGPGCKRSEVTKPTDKAAWLRRPLISDRGTKLAREAKISEVS